MKALKYIGGILLATLGVVFGVASVAELFDRDSEIPGWGAAVLFIVLGLMPLAGAVVVLRRRPAEVPPAHCPKCGGTKRAPAGVLRTSRNFWMMHFGGWLLGSLWGASRERQVRCLQCDALYFTETRGTRIAGILLWVFILLLLFGAIAQHFQERP